MRARTTVLVGIALVLLLVALGWLTHPRTTRPASAASVREPVGVESMRGVRPHYVTSLPSSLFDPGAPAVAPMIDDVLVEKSSICVGEENLITVSAHTEGGRDDAFLGVSVGGLSGRQVVVRGSLQEDKAETVRVGVTVTGRNGAIVHGEAPPFEVRNCHVARVLLVTPQLLPNSEAEFVLRARVLELEGASAFRAVRWRWNFGDGSPEVETDRPEVVHDFLSARHDTLHEDHLITVEAETRDGETLVGRHGLTVRSRYFDNLVHAGVVTLLVAMTPRFAQLGEDDIARQTFKLWHHEPAPVTIHRAMIARHRVGQAEPVIEELGVEKLLGTRTIAATGLTLAFELDRIADPRLQFVTYRLEGETRDGIPVVGLWSLMPPPPVPTRESHEPVDPVVSEIVKRATSMLGKDVVSADELQALLEKGAFDDIVRDRRYPIEGTAYPYATGAAR